MLTIYRRHLATCAYRSRRFKKCRCPIHVEGSLRGEKVRKALDLTAWEAASDLITTWNAVGEIGGVRFVIPSLDEAVQKYIEDAEARNLKPESVKKIRDVISRRLLSFCQRTNLTQLRHISVDAVRDFRNELASHYSANSCRKRLEYVQAFFRFAHNSGWMQVNPARSVKPPKADDTGVETFEPDEIDRMLAAADRFNPAGVFGAGIRKRVRTMILLLRYSGLRISDASLLSRDSLKGDKLLLRTIKTHATVLCPLPQEVISALDDCPNRDPRYFFWSGTSLPTSAVKIWERTFVRVFELADIPEHKRFVHNFRHSFSTDLLARGASVEDVATLLGNSVRIVEKHYSHLVRSRQARLEERVRKLWRDSNPNGPATEVTARSGDAGISLG